MGKHASVIPTAGLAVDRDVREVPFVELQGGRVQGVVSSGSDPQRVYVSFVESRTGDYYCCTNNNRPCGGLRGAPCKHIPEMVDEAIRQFGAAAVAAYLGVSARRRSAADGQRAAGAPARLAAERVPGGRLQPVPDLSPLLRAGYAAGHGPGDGLVRLMKALADLPAGVSRAPSTSSGGSTSAWIHGFARLGDEHRAVARGRRARSSPARPWGRRWPRRSRPSGGASSCRGRSSRWRRPGWPSSAPSTTRWSPRPAGRSAGPPSPRAEPPPRPTGASSPALASVQQWLMELAIAGFRQLEETAVAPFSATLEGLHADDGLTGLAVLLTGFHAELMRSMPASRLAEIPAFRWGDLWSAAMVRTQQLPPTVGFQSVSGSFVPLGLDVQSHENFVPGVALSAYSRVRTAATVRIPFGAYKVGVVAGAEVWDLLGESADPVLAASPNTGSCRSRGPSCGRTAIWSCARRPSSGPAADPFEWVAECDVDDRSAGPRQAPGPYRGGRPPGGRSWIAPGRGALLGGRSLPPGSRTLAELIALLRFDRGGWRYQPLCVRRRGGFVMAGEDLAAARRKLKHRTVDILKERAGRLLRKS